MSENPLKVSINVPGEAIDKAAAELLFGALGAPAAEVGSLGGDLIGIISDNARAWRSLNRIRIARKFKKKVEELGVEKDSIRCLPMREITVTLQAISDVDQPSLSDLWAGLLASAVNPNSEYSADSSFTSVIKMMTEEDAVLFSTIVVCDKMRPIVSENAKKNMPAPQALLDMGQEAALALGKENNARVRAEFSHLIEWVSGNLQLLKERDQLKQRVVNLHRLGLIEYGPSAAEAKRRMFLGSSGASRALREPVAQIASVVSGMEKADRLLEQWKTAPIASTYDFLPKFNIHVTEWGKKLSDACVIDLPGDIDP